MLSINKNQRRLIEVIVLTHQLVEPWEGGRLAALTKGVMAENPYQSGTKHHDEWARGFVFGSQWDVNVEEVELTDVAETLPVIEATFLPERSFWATAKRLQERCGLTNEQLAARIGVDVTRLMAAMISHRLNGGEAAAQTARFVS